MSRVALVVLLSLGASLLAPASLAQTQRRVDDADAVRDRALADLEAAADDRADASLHLALALADYEDANRELERIAYARAATAADLVAHEAEVRALRRKVEDVVVGAYIAGGTDPLAMSFDVSPGPERIIAEHVANIEAGRTTAAIDALAAARAELDDLRRSHDADRRREAELRAEVTARAALLDELLIATGQSVVAATSAVATADAEYQAALSAYEEEQRRLAALGGVVRWQPLVERYFPPERVDEALRVMHCESRGNPDARHPVSDAAGLFQFLAGTWAFASARAGWEGYSRYHPEANVASAAWLVDFSIRTGHRWGAWGRWACRHVATGTQR